MWLKLCSYLIRVEEIADCSKITKIWTFPPVMKRFENLQVSCKTPCKRMHSFCKLFANNLQDHLSNLQEKCKLANQHARKMQAFKSLYFWKNRRNRVILKFPFLCWTPLSQGPFKENLSNRVDTYLFNKFITTIRLKAKVHGCALFYSFISLTNC